MNYYLSAYMKGIATIACLVLLLFSAGCKNTDAEQYKIRVALVTKEDHTWFKAFKYFESLVEERSKGRVAVEIYPSEQLAKEVESIRLIQSGVIEMTMTGSLMSNWIDVAAFCELPFLLRDSIDKKILIEGPIGKRIEQDMLEIVGLRPVATIDRGPRHLTSNRPIRHPDDLKGLIIRVPNVPSFVTAWSAMGAKPTPMAFSEVFTSLQQGTVEAQENPFAMISSAGFAEVQQYLNLTEHVVSWAYVVIGEKFYQSLPEDLQLLITQAAYDMRAYEQSIFQANERKVQNYLKEKGMEFIEVNKDAFALKCKDAIYQSLSGDMKILYQYFINSRDSIRLNMNIN